MAKNIRKNKRLTKRRMNSSKKRLTKRRMKVSKRKSRMKVYKKRLTKRRMKVSKRKNKQKMKGGAYTEADVNDVMEAVLHWNQTNPADLILFPRRRGEAVFEFLKKNRRYIEQMGLRDTFNDIFDDREDWEPGLTDTSGDIRLAEQMKSLSIGPPEIGTGPLSAIDAPSVQVPADDPRGDRLQNIEAERAFDRQQVLLKAEERRLQRAAEAENRRARRGAAAHDAAAHDAAAQNL